MNVELLKQAVAEIQDAMAYSITTATYAQNSYRTGLEAKTALIRSETLIQRIHEVTKRSLHEELTSRGIHHEVHPPLGNSSPELDVWGLLKKKKQDLVVIVGNQERRPERIEEGPLKGYMDGLGKQATKHSIVIGVRSQLSSVAKNFDTLMERAFAETLNLRLRHPYLVMGEVYLLAIKDYDEQLMKRNQVGWKNRFTDVEKFISIFNGMSHREAHDDVKEAYKYERSVLLLIDLSVSPPKIYTDIEELKQDGAVSPRFDQDYSALSPEGFSRDIVDAYLLRHTP